MTPKCVRGSFARRPHALLAAALLVVPILVGCAASPETNFSPDESAVAFLDLETGEIVMPLSAYDIVDTNRDIETLNRALRLAIAPCMERRGLSYTAAGLGDEDRIVDDRPYGIWLEAQARVYGFGFEPSVVDAALGQDQRDGGEAWAIAEGECSEEVRATPEVQAFMPSNEDVSTSIVATIRTEAYRLAAASPQWQSSREKWWECLRDAGLTPLTGAYDWGTTSDVPTSVGADGRPVWSQDSIRVAYLQAQCNMSTGLTQTLANLEAGYQAVLIDQNQSAMNVWKTEKLEKLQAARDYIQTHG